MFHLLFLFHLSQISKVSTAVIDPDFSKMQSIVVSDPADPTKLLVVVNVAALGRRNLELVRMIPVPYFESGTAYEIILGNNSVTYSGTGSSLTKFFIKSCSHNGFCSSGIGFFFLYKYNCWEKLLQRCLQP